MSDEFKHGVFLLPTEAKFNFITKDSNGVIARIASLLPPKRRKLLVLDAPLAAPSIPRPEDQYVTVEVDFPWLLLDTAPNFYRYRVYSYEASPDFPESHMTFIKELSQDFNSEEFAKSKKLSLRPPLLPHVSGSGSICLYYGSNLRRANYQLWTASFRYYVDWLNPNSSAKISSNILCKSKGPFSDHCFDVFAFTEEVDGVFFSRDPELLEKSKSFVVAPEPNESSAISIYNMKLTNQKIFTGWTRFNPETKKWIVKSHADGQIFEFPGELVRTALTSQGNI